MDFAGLIEPAIISLYINRSHKLEVPTDVGQNYSLVLLDAVHSKTKSKKGGWVLGCKCGFRGFQAGKKCFCLFLGSKQGVAVEERLMVERKIQNQESLYEDFQVHWPDRTESSSEKGLWHGPGPGLTFPFCVPGFWWKVKVTGCGRGYYVN